MAAERMVGFIEHDEVYITPELDIGMPQGIKKDLWG
jgi:hypothetical protein